MNKNLVAGRLGTLVAGAAAAVALVAGPASAATVVPGEGSGDLCSAQRVTDPGAVGCIWTNSFAANSRWTVQLGAFDRARDGLSARTLAYVDQYNAAGTYLGRNTLTTTESNGAGLTRISPSTSIYHLAGATKIRLTLFACTYNAPTGSYQHYTSGVWNYTWA